MTSPQNLNSLNDVKLGPDEYGVAILCHTDEDDGIVRVVFPSWLSSKIQKLSQEQLQIIYDEFIKKLAVPLDYLLKELQQNATTITEIQKQDK